jgi:hypothetical protein
LSQGILLDLLEVLKINGHITIVFLTIAQLLVQHSPNQVQLLDIPCLFGVGWSLGELLIDLVERLLPALQLDQVDDHIIVVFSDINRAKANL